MTIPPSVSTFDQLIDWLLRTQHEGKPYRMAKALGVSSALPFQWRDRVVKAPSPEKLMKLCEVYTLDPAEVWHLLRPNRMAPIGGGSANDDTQALASVADVLRLIGDYLLAYFLPRWRLASA